MTRKEACFYLGVGEYATEEQIKKAYHYKVKLYHPDVNPDKNTNDYYIKVQEAYEFLMTSQPQYTNITNITNIRPTKIYSTTTDTKKSYQKQKDIERERKKIQKWDEEYRENRKHQQQINRYGEKYADSMSNKSKSKEDEVLDKIRAIWLAETIKRQIQADKEEKELNQKRKLYQAFMKHEMNENEDE
jgi:hypothetical protein